MHKLNIIHRDIKIDNVLVADLQRHSTFKLGDFGSAVRLASANDTAQLRTGTQGYMAPEMLKGASYNCAVDIYSLGALLYALLSAKLPFWDSDSQKMKKRMISETLNL